MSKSSVSTQVRGSFRSEIVAPSPATTNLIRKDPDLLKGRAKQAVLSGKYLKSHSVLGDFIIQSHAFIDNDVEDSDKSTCKLLLGDEKPASSAPVTFISAYIKWPGGEISEFFGFKKAVIKWKMNIGKITTHREEGDTWEGAYMVTYATLGIPPLQFSWLDRVCRENRAGLKVEWKSLQDEGGYKWINVRLPKGLMFHMRSSDGRELSEAATDIMRSVYADVEVFAACRMFLRRKIDQDGVAEALLRPSVCLEHVQVIGKAKVPQPPKAVV